MHWPYFKRCRRLCGVPRGWWTVVASGLLTACIVPLLLLLFGLVTELFVSPPIASAKGESLGWMGSRLNFSFTERPAPLSRLAELLLSGLVLSGALSLCVLLGNRAASRAAASVAAGVKRAVFRQAFRLGASDVLMGRSAAHEELFTHAAERLRKASADWWRAVPRAAALLIALLALAVLINAWMVAAALLVAAIVAFAYYHLRTRDEEQSRLWNDRLRYQHDLLLDSLRQVPLVTGYAAPSPPGEALDDALRRYETTSYQATVRGVSTAPLLMLFVLTGVILLLFVVGMNVLPESPDLTVPKTVVLMAALICAYFPAARLYRLRKSLFDVEETAREVMHYLERDPTVSEAPHPQTLPRLSAELVFDTVTLADRAGHKLLDQCTLRIPAGATAAVVASEAAVPAALAGLLARFYDPAAGRIAIDGHDLRLGTLASVRGQILLARSDGMLFTGTAGENIAGGDANLTQSQLSEAAKLAGAYEFIQGLSQGFATQVGEHGTRLETSQAFRVGLARAALRNPALLIIEEPELTKAAAAQAQIDEVLARLEQGRAVLYLPARIETLRRVQRVYLLHQGKLLAEGTHAELLQQSELYRHLVYLRFNEFRGVVR